MRVRATMAALAVLGASPAYAASTQPYPTKPVRIVVAFGPGGIADTIGRLVSQKLAARLGQPMVVDNRAGAGGTVGARIAASAAPDGHTLLVTTAAVAVNANAPKDPLDPRTQFTPIALAASAPTIFAVHRSVTAKSLLDYVRNAKGGRFTYSTAGLGTTEHLSAEFLFRSVPALEGTHVPFQGGAAPVAAVVAQQVDLTSTTVPTAYPFIKQGALRVLAIASRKRNAVLPDVPTLGESGFPDFENASWIAFFAPARVPSAIVQKLNAEVNAALREPDVRERLALLGFETHAMSAADFAAYVRSEVEKWAKVIKATGITPQ
jgi:tripartite-type tricarboxylate transporter receptor subunit TctC